MATKEEAAVQPVSLHVYDISYGMARNYSQTFLGKQLEGIWHTGVVVFGKEWYWGGEIQEDRPGKTPYGTPTKVIKLGETFVPEEVFRDFISEIRPRYRLDTYQLLSNNCNNFSQEVTQFLTGQSIPADILNLPDEALTSPMGQMIKPMLLQYENMIKQQLTAQYYGGSSTGNQTTPSFSPPPFQMPLMPQMPQVSRTSQPSQPLSQPQSRPSNIDIRPNVTQHQPQQSQSQPQAISQPQSSTSTSGSKWIQNDKKPLLATQNSIPPTVIAKLKQSTKLNPTEISLLESVCTYLSDTTKDKANPPEGTYKLFSKIIKEWGVTELFHTMFIFRLLVARPAPNEYYAHEKETMMSVFQRLLIEPCTKTVQSMALASAANMFAHSSGEQFMMSQQVVTMIFSPTLQILQQATDNSLKLMAVTVLYNYAVFMKYDAFEEEILLTITGLFSMLKKTVDEDTAMRLLLSLGQLLLSNKEVKEIINSMEFESLMHDIASWNESQRVKEALHELFALLK